MHSYAVNDGIHAYFVVNFKIALINVVKWFAATEEILYFSGETLVRC